MKLSHGELSFLRKAMEEKFLSGQTRPEPLNKTSYTLGYRALLKDIFQRLDPEKKSLNYIYGNKNDRIEQNGKSIASLNRLAKLFTCQIESAKFHDHFIDLCYRYISDGKHVRATFPIPTQESENLDSSTSHPPQISKTQKYLTGVLLVLGFLFLLIFCNRRPMDFEEDFRIVSEAYLNSRGWRFVDKDEFLLRMVKPKEGALGLSTAAGDIWVKEDSGEQRMIKNMLVREIPDEDFEIVTHISGFYPHQPHQQAGIVLLDDTVKKNTFIRFTITHNHPEEKKMFPGYFFRVQIAISIDGVIEYAGVLGDQIPERVPGDTIRDRKYENVWLRITRNGKGYQFAFRVFSQTMAFRYVCRTDMIECSLNERSTVKLKNFQPRFLGLGAYHGFTDEAHGKPLNADTIPAYFESFKLSYFD